jgi:citrate synthase
MPRAVSTRLDELEVGQEQAVRRYVARLISQVRTIAAFSYRKSRGLPLIYPKQDYKYTANFLHMLFSMPYEDYE